MEYFSKKSAERLAAALLNRKDRPMIDARKFWTMCRLHDWFYMMSEDPEVYRDGEEYLDRLGDLMRGRPDLYAIYDAWRAHHYECGPVPAEPKLEEEKLSATP